MEYKVYNNTPFSLETIVALPIIGRVRSNWRQRHITIHAHPTDAARVISVGTTFDNTMQVICDDARTDWSPDLSQDRIIVTN